MSTQVFGPFLTSNSKTFSYTTAPSVNRISYPPSSEALGVLGPIFVPSLYARDLDNIEIGSSGSIALSILDRYTLSITKNTDNETVFQSVDSEPISIQPGDAAKSVKVGDLAVSSTDIGGGARRVNLGASAFRFGNFLDVAQTSANAVSLNSGALSTNITGKGVGFVDAATNFTIANFGRSPGESRLSLKANAATDTSVLAATTVDDTTLSNFAILANDFLIKDSSGVAALTIARNNNVLTLTAGDPLAHPMTMNLVSTDLANSVTIGGLNASTVTDATTGLKSTVINTSGVSDSLDAGFLFKKNLSIDPLKTLYVGNICGYTGNLVLDTGVIIKGSLTVTDIANSSTVTWNTVHIRDKLLKLSNGSTSTYASSPSGFKIDCGANVTTTPSFTWNSNNQIDAVTKAVSADAEAFWRFEGGHMRLSAGDIEYGFRINKNKEMELFKVRYDTNGGQVGTAIVVNRWGAAAPAPRYP